METTSDAVVLWNKFLKYCGISLSKMSDAELMSQPEFSLTGEESIVTERGNIINIQQYGTTSALNRSDMLLSVRQRAKVAQD